MNSEHIIATRQTQKLDILSSRKLVEEITIYFDPNDSRIVPNENKQLEPVYLIPKKELPYTIVNSIIIDSLNMFELRTIPTEDWIKVCSLLMSGLYYMEKDVYYTRFGDDVFAALQPELTSFKKELSDYFKQSEIRYYNLDGLSEEDLEELEQNQVLLLSDFLVKIAEMLRVMETYFETTYGMVDEKRVTIIVAKIEELEKSKSADTDVVGVLQECRDLIYDLYNSHVITK